MLDLIMLPLGALNVGSLNIFLFEMKVFHIYNNSLFGDALIFV